ncbi:MAG: hypothetical protein R3C49_19785 [Planctomycetaceae bacterium]
MEKQKSPASPSEAGNLNLISDAQNTSFGSRGILSGSSRKDDSCNDRSSLILNQCTKTSEISEDRHLAPLCRRPGMNRQNRLFCGNPHNRNAFVASALTPVNTAGKGWNFEKRRLMVEFIGWRDLRPAFRVWNVFRDR